MTTYKMPVTWQMYGYMEVEAENMEEALLIANKAALPEGKGEYVDDSFCIDTCILEEDYPGELENVVNHKALINLE